MYENGCEKLQLSGGHDMDFDKELEAFRKRVLHLEKDSDTNYLPLPEDNNLDMQLNTPASNPVIFFFVKLLMKIYPFLFISLMKLFG